MAKILSQEEIDALLSNVPGEQESDSKAEPKQKISLYDFKHPNLVSKEQMRLLETIHEGLCRNFGVFLSAQLRMIVEMNLLAIDQIMYSEFVMSIVPPSSIYVFETKEENPAQFVMEMSPQLAIFIVERLFGGQGSSIAEARAISVIEQRIMRHVVDRFLVELSKNWEPVAPLESNLVKFESNPEFVQIVPSSEPVIVASMEVKIHGTTSLMNICYPYMWISNILTRPEVQKKILFGARESSTEERDIVEYNIKNTSVPLRMILGKSNISIRDFLELKKGDVIQLMNRTNSPLEVFVQNKHLFYGVAGIRNKRYAVRILSTAEGEEDDG